MKSILVLCTGNSCRSQMAEGWLRFFAGNQAEVYSAGIETHGLNPRAVKVMGEAGIDITSHTSDLVEKYISLKPDYVITVCDNAKESCPIFPGKTKTIHHSFFDPAKANGSEEDILDEFRNVRDEIKLYSKEFINKYV